MTSYWSDQINTYFLFNFIKMAKVANKRTI